MTIPKIVVTGLGAVTPLGLSTDVFWNALVEGTSGIGPITRFDCRDFAVRIGAEVKGFDPSNYMDEKQARRTGLFVQLAVAASSMAVKDAGLKVEREADQVGVVVGTSATLYGSGQHVRLLEERGPRRVDPYMLGKVAAHMAPVTVGRLLGAQGPCVCVQSACASGGEALAVAAQRLRLGQAQAMVAGGAESLVDPLSIAYFAMVGALTREEDPAKACRPFDLHRSGFVAGEGAGMLVLETEEHALRRGATILAEVAGTGCTYDCFDDTAPNAQGQARAMAAAIRDAGIRPQEIDYVNAHGTSTKLNDAVETQALKLALGDHAYRVPISSNKSMTGHLSAAGGAVEAIACIKSLLTGVIPPTINYQTPDPECDLDYVPNVARRADISACLSNSFGLGGQNACAVFLRYPYNRPTR